MRKGLADWRKAPTDAATARLWDLLERRWALRVIWELRGGALTFRGLQAACGQISPSVLQTRLHELHRRGLIEKIARLGYRLSGRGERLYQRLEPLADWAGEQENTLQANKKLHKKT